MGSLAGPKARREPAGEAKTDVCVISDGEAGAYCTVGLVFIFADFCVNGIVWGNLHSLSVWPPS